MATSPQSGRLSRETRQLLTAALLALVALWVLARIRFPDQPATSNPIPSLLSQLSPAPRFANLAGEIADLQARLSSRWIVVPVVTADDSGAEHPGTLPAIRFQPDAALTLVSDRQQLTNASSIMAADAATGLTVVRTDAPPVGAGITPWVPPNLDRPRYFMAAVAAEREVLLRPVLVGALVESYSPAWSGPIWSAPPGTDLQAGSFVFTIDGEIAGLAIAAPDGPAIVPWDFVSAEAARILEHPSQAGGDLQVEVQALTPRLARATGSQAGVVVSWVDAGGPAASLEVGDVIEGVNDRAIDSEQTWNVTRLRLPPGPATLRVRRRHALTDVAVTVPAAAGAAQPLQLGLTLRDVRGAGVSIARVEPRSAGRAAGLLVDDLITLAAGERNPTAQALERAFEAAAPGDVLMLGVTRGDTHLVVGLVK
jgi:hypothetical protein